MAFGPVKPLPRASARPQAKAQKQKQAKAHAQAQAQAQAQATPKAGPSTLSNTAQDSDATTILPPPPLLALAAVAGRLFGTATAAERRSAAWKAMVQKRRVELAKRAAGAVPAVYLDAPHAHDGNTTTTNAATDVTAPGATMPTTRRSGLRSGSSSASIESAGANASSVPNETRSGYATRLTKSQSYLLNKVFESITPFPLDEWIYIMAIASGRSPHQIKAWFRKQRAAQRPRHLIVIETEEMDKVMMRPKIVRENFVWSDGMFADVVEAIGIFGADS